MNEPLTDREIEILRLTADGSSNSEIAARLFLSLNTVKWYNKRIYEKLEVENRTQAIKRAQTLGILAASPSLPPPARPRPHLPTPLTTFVGRRAEIDHAKQLLRQNRLLTLTGAGGVGKTRLALQIAHEVADSFADGVYFVDLSSINEARHVINSIAHVLNVAETHDMPLLKLLDQALHQKHLLLVLDNFEHLIDAASLVAELLAATDDLKCLITSREVLALYGEQEYVVPPLRLPDLEWFASEHLGVNRLLASEALQLFERCAQAISPDFRLTSENAPAIASICLRLDGLPLAIELAAAYIKLLAPQVMLTQLDSMWLEMKRSLRNIPARQQTLRNTIEWSVRFLNEEERRLFARMAVFRGGCTWEAITSVCALQSTVEASTSSTASLLESLNGLISKSLVWRRIEVGDQPRFGMLETIREFALDCLRLCGEVEALQRRHTLYYTEYTSRVESELMSIRQRQVLNQMEREVDNHRAALRWAIDHDPGPGLQMIGDLGSCWRIRGYLTEGMEWAQQLLSVSQHVPIPIQARAYSSSAVLALVLGHRSQARQLAEVGYQLAQESGDRRSVTLAIHAWVQTRIAPNLAAAEYEKIIALIHEAADNYSTLGNQLGRARILNMLGEVMRMQERYDEAKHFYEESLQGLRTVGYQSGVAAALHNLGWTFFHLGAEARAYTAFVESLDLSYELAYHHNVALCLIGVASSLSRLHHPQVAVKLLSVADVIRRSIGVVVDQSDEPDCQRTIAELHASLGQNEFDRYWQAGRTLSLSEAVALVHTY